MTRVLSAVLLAVMLVGCTTQSGPRVDGLVGKSTKLDPNLPPPPAVVIEGTKGTYVGPTVPPPAVTIEGLNGTPVR